MDRPETPLQVADLIKIYSLKSKDSIEYWLNSKSPSWFYHDLSSDRTSSHVWMNNSLKTSIGLKWDGSELRYEENKSVYNTFLDDYETLGFNKVNVSDDGKRIFFESNTYKLGYWIIASDGGRNVVITLYEKYC